MSREPIVLLHGSGTGAYSWSPISHALTTLGLDVFAPVMLAYGRSPPASDAYGIAEEVAHLRALLDARGIGDFHLVAHSLGAMFGLHLRFALGARVTRLTLIEPVVTSILLDAGEHDAYAELWELHERFMGVWPDHAAAAQVFVEYWSGPGSWRTLRNRERAMLTAVAPKLRVEMVATRTDMTPLTAFAASAPPTTLIVGENTREAARTVARLLGPAFDARTLVVPGASHTLPLTHPVAVIEALCGGRSRG